MRIIGGKNRGRNIRVPAGLPVRPTTDMAREALFNILNNLIDLEGISFLDLFAGTGAVSYEMASRGASSVTCVEINPKCCQFIRETSAIFESTAFTIQKADVFRYLQKSYQSFDMIFADAPYAEKKIPVLPGLILEGGWLKPGGLLVVEHPAEIVFSASPHCFDHRKYGAVNFSFFKI